MYCMAIKLTYSADYVCTSRVVKTCSADMIACRGFRDRAVQDQFDALFPDAYGQVCEESDGELCLYTDIVYDACAKVKGRQV